MEETKYIYWVCIVPKFFARIFMHEFKYLKFFLRLKYFKQTFEILFIYVVVLNPSNTFH